MKQEELQSVLQVTGQILIDNAGNRLTRAQCIGICGDLENNLRSMIEPEPSKEPPKEPQ